MKIQRWAVLFRTRSRTAPAEHFLCERGVPVLFRTRQEARKWEKEHCSYIRERRDLRAKPHCWRIPTPVKVLITVEQTGGG